MIKTITSEFVKRRAKLPHWQSGGGEYFITFRSVIGQLNHACLSIVAETIRFDHNRRYTLWMGVAMPDHAHVILQPLECEPGKWFDLSSIIKTIKGVSSRKINQELAR